MGVWLPSLGVVKAVDRLQSVVEGVEAVWASTGGLAAVGAAVAVWKAAAVMDEVGDGVSDPVLTLGWVVVAPEVGYMELKGKQTD